MVVYTCKKCGELDYLTSKALGDLTDFGFKCHFIILLYQNQNQKKEYERAQLII
jgi:hypothetical protein